MVRILASSVTFLLLTVAAVKAQTAPIVITDYPTVNQIPPTNSPEVIAWLKEVNLAGAPTIPLHVGAPPPCPNPPIPNECYWTCDGCSSDDITFCGLPNTWGLTFDDGPTTATPPLLDYLKAQKLSATFFTIGSQVIQFPATVQREIAEGHHLASHTWSHHALTTLTNEQIVAEMKWTEKAVLAATGKKLKYMRPPYGDINNRVRFVLKQMGYIPVDWTGDAFDTNDWRMPTWTEAQVISTFTASLDAYAASPKTTGFYCLEHDLNPLTVGVAQKLIPLGIARNIQIKNVAQCQSDANGYQGAAAPSNSSSSSVSGTASGSATASGSNPSQTSTGSAVNVSKSAAVSVKSGVSAAAAGVVAALAAFLA